MDTLKSTSGATASNSTENPSSASTHTEDQKRHIYENLPAEQRQQQSYAEWAKEVYHDQYEKWMPWLEDQYLKWFGKGENKASYATKDTLSKSKVTGVKQVDQIQDDVNNMVGNQLGENGLLAPVGNALSKEGVNRAERGGKDENGSYGGPLGGVTDPVVSGAKGAGQGVASGAQSLGSSVAGGAKSVGGLFGGSGDAGNEKKE